MGNLSGSKIKGYELQERIGVGGFGEVYRATQTAVGREVAIKVILPTLANQAEFVRRFETEAQLVARLEHLHITPLYDYWRDPEGAYLVMRMLRGGNLSEAIDSGSMDLEKSAQIVDQVSSALVTAHRNKVIHQDIKPSNILLDEDGNAYLTDFGIAQDLNKVDLETTDPGALIGSPAYLSPEQARSAQVTPQTDIYSLGIVLYEMLTGEHPFPEDNVMQVMFKHMEEDVPKIDSLSPDIGEKVNGVIQKATAKDPTKRYEDVHAFAAAFRKAVGLNISQIAENIVELLTPREQEVLKLIIKGKSNREISEALTIELTTVKWYVTQIYRKLNVRSRVQAIARAREMNLVVDGKDSVTVTAGITGLPEPENPYKGLMAFRSADEQNFYGREKLIEKLLQKMDLNGKHPSFMAVVGPSGSGKSSLVSAGLIPALWRGELDGSQNWYIVEMIPGEKPLDELEVALTRIATDKSINLNEQLKRDANGLSRAAKMILPNDGSELLLVVDQFEELFTLVEEEEVRAHFLDLICSAVNDKRSRVRVVVTLRADFYDRPLQYPEFGKLIQQQVETVLPLSADELERAIVKPAHSSGVGFEDGLVPTIIKDIHYQPGALPLLQYALTELFEKREGRNLTHTAYQQMGGVVGALARQAEEVYNELNEEGQEAVRQMFLRLVTMGEGVEDTRRRVSRAELLEIAKDPDLTDEIIDTYAAYRLLSLDNDLSSRMPTVEVAHEAILREWGQLRKWLNESRTDIRLQRQLARAAKDWRKAKEDASFLLHGARLEQFEGWRRGTELALTRTEKEYLKASITLRDKEQIEEKGRQARERALEKRSQNVLRWLVGVFAVAAFMSGWLAFRANKFGQEAEASASAEATAAAIAQENEALALTEAEARAEAEAVALEERHQALLQASIGLAGQVLNEMNSLHMPERAVPLGLEALDKYPYTWQAQSALSKAVIEHNLEMLIPHDTLVFTLDLSEDGTRLLTGCDDDTLRIYDAASGEELMLLSGGTYARFSPDGSAILSIDAEFFMLRIWDAVTGELRFSAETDSEFWLTTYDWNPWSADGTRFLTTHDDGTIRIWDTATKAEMLRLTGYEKAVIEAVWSPDDSYILSTNGEVAILWDVATGEALHTFPGTIWGIRFGDWSATGDRFILRGFERATVYDTAMGEELFTLPTPENWNEVALFSPDKSRIITTTNWGNLARVWDFETGALLFTFTGNTIAGWAYWSPSGDYVAMETGDGLAIWDMATGTQVKYLASTGMVRDIEWSPSEDRIYVMGRRYSEVRVYSMSKAVMTIPGKSGMESYAAWSPDGSKIARGYPDGSIKIWDAKTGEEQLVIQALGEDVNVLEFSPSGDRIFAQMWCDACFEDNNVSVWDASSGELLLQVITPGTALSGGGFSPDGSKVIVGDFFGDDPQVAVWDVAAGEKIWSAPAVNVYGADWSPDGEYIAVSDAGQLVLFDAETGEEIRRFFEISFVAIGIPTWSSDSTQIAVGSDEIVWIFDAKSGELVNSFSGSAGTIDWTIDEYMLTNDNSGFIRVYDIANGAEMLAYDIGGWPMASLSPDKTQVLISSADGNLTIYPMWLDVEELIDYAKECCTVHELTPKERELFGLPAAEEQLVMP